MSVAFYIGNNVVNFGIGKRVYGAYRDIGENALFTIAKREISIGFLLLSV